MISQIRWRDYLTLTLGYVCILLMVFFIMNILHFQWLHPKIVLHGMMLDMIFSVVITWFLLKVFGCFPWDAVLLTNACIIFILFASLYSILGPTMCDRSLSVFLLAKVKESYDFQKPITTHDLIQAVDSQYVKGDHMVEKRIDEHQASGAIKINQGVVTLTPVGNLIAWIFEFFYWALDIQKKF